jgi:hypothetical protein
MAVYYSAAGLPEVPLGKGARARCGAVPYMRYSMNVMMPQQTTSSLRSPQLQDTLHAQYNTFERQSSSILATRTTTSASSYAVTISTREKEGACKIYTIPVIHVPHITWV